MARRRVDALIIGAGAAGLAAGWLNTTVELAGGADPSAVTPAMESAIRDVMKLRGGVEVVAAGSIPEGAKKISDERTWD